MLCACERVSLLPGREWVLWGDDGANLEPAVVVQGYGVTGERHRQIWNLLE